MSADVRITAPLEGVDDHLELRGAQDLARFVEAAQDLFKICKNDGEHAFPLLRMPRIAGPP